MKRKTSHVLLIIVCGLFVGIYNGLLGGGGGIFVIPILEKFLIDDEKKVHATSICLILPLCIVSSIIYSFYNNPFNFNLLYLSIGCVLGAIIGALILSKINSKIVVLIFSLILLVSGIKILI